MKFNSVKRLEIKSQVRAVVQYVLLRKQFLLSRKKSLLMEHKKKELLLLAKRPMPELVNVSVVHPRDLGSNLGTDRKYLSNSVSVSFEFQAVGC